MTNRKNIIKVASIAFLGSALATLAGCGGGNHSIAYDVDLSIDPTGAEITFWSPFGQDINKVLNEDVINPFCEETGIKVTVEDKTGYDALLEAISLGTSSGNYPNVSVGYPDHFVTYVQNDIIVRLDHYLENDHLTPAVNGKKYNVSLADFYADYMVENQSIEYKDDGTGYTLGLPFNKSTEVVTYNKSFFQFAQSVDPSIKVPTTYQELDQEAPKIINVMSSAAGRIVAAKGTKTNPTAFEVVDNEAQMSEGFQLFLDTRSVKMSEFRPFAYDSQANFFISSMRNWGSKYTEKDTTPGSFKGYLAFNEDDTRAKTISWMKDIRDLYKKGYLGIPDTWEEKKYTSNQFKGMSTVMVTGSTAGVGHDAPAGGAFQIDAMPVLTRDAERRNVISQGTNLCMFDKGTEKERCASWLLVKYMAKYANALFSVKTGYFPSGPYAEESEIYQEFINRKPTFMTTAEKIQQAAARVNQNHYLNPSEHWTKFIDDAFVGSAYIREHVVPISKNTCTTDRTFQSILDEVYDDLKDYVRK